MAKLTKAQRAMLELAAQSTTGNPWTLISVRHRSGGAATRMFAKLQEAGFFGRDNCITPAGRAALNSLEEP